MPIEARRVFRVSLTVALALVVAYAMGKPLPYLAPIFALVLSLAPKPPMGLKSLVGLAILVGLTLGSGLLLIPIMRYYALSGVLIVMIGVFFATYVSVNLGKGAVGSFLTMGFTLIPAAGMIDTSVSITVIEALLMGITTAVVCQWIVYPLFPEDPMVAAAPAPKRESWTQSDWIARRATLIIMPVFVIALTDPSTFLSVIMKAVALGKQTSVVDARRAGRELLGSTFMGGCFAIVIWFGLDCLTNLWMFFLLTLFFGIVLTSKFYHVFPGRYPPSFWMNVFTTMLILLGSAVQDSAGGKNVYKAFAVRMGLFIVVTLYAWFTLAALEFWRSRRLARTPISTNTELTAS